jgi:hypothetical protein
MPSSLDEVFLDDVFAPLRLKEQPEKQATKGTHARWASAVWIVSGLYLYTTTAGVSLFSWSALGFFLVGTVLASIVLGSGSSLVHQALAAVLAKTLGRPPGPKMAIAVTMAGFVLVVAEVAIGYQLAKAAFQTITQI